MLVTVLSYRWRAVYLFSEGFRVQDIATILHVGCTFLKKLIKLHSETSTVNYPAERAAAQQNKALGWYVYTMYFADFLRQIGKLTSKIPYQLITLRFLCPVSK